MTVTYDAASYAGCHVAVGRFRDAGERKSLRWRSVPGCRQGSICPGQRHRFYDIYADLFPDTYCAYFTVRNTAPSWWPHLRAKTSSTRAFSAICPR